MSAIMINEKPIYILLNICKNLIKLTTALKVPMPTIIFANIDQNLGPSYFVALRQMPIKTKAAQA